MSVKALFFQFDNKPFQDVETLIQMAKAEAKKIFGGGKVKVLNILSCSYPKGYVVVVQNPGRREGKKEFK